MILLDVDAIITLFCYLYLDLVETSPRYDGNAIEALSVSLLRYRTVVGLSLNSLHTLDLVHEALPGSGVLFPKLRSEVEGTFP
jgi:hypothetical protein